MPNHRPPSDDFWPQFAEETRESLFYAEAWTRFEADDLRHLVDKHSFDPVAAAKAIGDSIADNAAVCSETSSSWVIGLAISLLDLHIEFLVDGQLKDKPGSLLELTNTTFHSIMAATFHRIMQRAMERDPAIEKLVVDSPVTRH